MVLLFCLIALLIFIPFCSLSFLLQNGWFLQVHFIVSSTVLFLPLNLGSLRQLETSLVAQRLKCLPTMRETQVQSLGREDPLEQEMATHSSILAWRIPWKEEPGRLQSTGSQRVGHDWATSLSLSRLYQDKHGKSTGFPIKGKSNFNIGKIVWNLRIKLGKILHCWNAVISQGENYKV